MADRTERLTDHYETDALVARIKDGLRAAGEDPDAPSVSALKLVDEFHTGGIEATEALLEQLDIEPDMHVLDCGSGIGGTARHIAERYGARVTGVDLTPLFVDTATRLSEMTGLGPRTRFVEGSVTALPVEADAFDLVTMFHVGMNVADKPALFGQVARALRAGGRFALFDIMAGAAAAEIAFPVPWAPSHDLSFVASPEDYRAAAAEAGLRLVAERDRSDYARGYFDRVIAAIEAHGPPPVGLHLIMGEEAETRYRNAVAAAFAGATAPWEMIFAKPG